MKKKETTLRAFLTENLVAQGLEADENVLNALVEAVTLEEGDPDEKEETRSIRITEDTDGKITAKSIKLYNLMKVSYHDLLGFLIKETAIPFLQDSRVKIIFALLTLLHEFYPKLTYRFNEQDAKILLSIYELGQKEFVASDVPAAFLSRFNQPLTDDQVQRSLSYLKGLKVFEDLGGGKYALQEKMIYERN